VVFTAVTMKNVFFWDVAACRFCANRRFGGTYRLYLQGRKIRQRGTSVAAVWMRYIPLKRRFTQDLHGATSQKTAFFKSIIRQYKMLQSRFDFNKIVIYIHFHNWILHVDTLSADARISPYRNCLPSYERSYIGSEGAQLSWLFANIDNKCSI
jgi:hypothetical protein